MKRSISSLILLILMISCRNQPEGQVTAIPPEVPVALITKILTGIPVEVAGRITTRDETRLSFKKGGIIENVYVEEGETVKKDQLLARLKQDEFEAVRIQAELAVDKALRDFDRVSNLYRDSVATLEQYQNSRTALEIAEQMLSGTLFNVSYTEIRAPSNGKILKKLASPGEITGEGIPIILFGSTDSQWVLKTSIADRDVVRCELGDSAVVYLDAWPGRPFPAVVTEISGMADPYTGTFDVELMLVRNEKRLAAGLIGKALLYPSDASWYWIIPSEALLEGDGRKARIFEFRDGMTGILTIQVDAVRGDNIYAKDIPEDSLYVITGGHQFLSEGMDVKPSPHRQ
ncbi:MAG: efflux RND transporter periplasmic adaptor subunit [Bacteroidales bacterium]|nr:efflux RND transporter periplasmic adaptor subunit [Bacteroidales bacterium]